MKVRNMKIASVGSAFPKYYYPQPVLSAALKKYWDGRLHNSDVVDRMHAHAEIDGPRELTRTAKYSSIHYPAGSGIYRLG